MSNLIAGTDIVTIFTDVDFNITYQLQVTCTDNRITQSTHKNVSVQTFNVSFRTESVCTYLVINTYISANSSINSYTMTNKTVIRKHVTKTGLHYVSLADITILSNSVTLAGSPVSQAATKYKYTLERTTNRDQSAEGTGATKIHGHGQATSIKDVTNHFNTHRHQSSRQLFKKETIATVPDQASAKSPAVASFTTNDMTVRNATDVSITENLFTVSKVTFPASTRTVSLFTYSANGRMHSNNTTPATNVNLPLINASIVTSETNTIQSFVSNLNATVSPAKESISSTTSLSQSKLSKNTAGRTEDGVTSPTHLLRLRVTNKNRNNLTTIGPVLTDCTYLSLTVPTDGSQESTESIKPWTEVNGNDTKILPVIKDFDNIINIAAIATGISFVIGVMVSAGACCVIRKLCSTPEVPR